MKHAHKWKERTRINRVVGKRLLPHRSSTPHRILPETPSTNEPAQPLALQREPSSKPVTLNHLDSTSSQREQPPSHTFQKELAQQSPSPPFQRELAPPSSVNTTKTPPTKSQKASFERENNVSHVKTSDIPDPTNDQPTGPNSPLSATSFYNQCSRKNLLLKYKTKMARIAHSHELRSNCVDLNPLSFASTLADQDTMYLHQAMKQPDWKHFKEAMKSEIAAHTDNNTGPSFHALMYQ